MTFTILCDSERQEIDGFGVCGAFHQAGHLMNFREPERSEVLDLLFSTEKGAGLSILRNIVGDGGIWGDAFDGPTPSIEPAEGEFSWSGDEEQIWLMQEAGKRGCHRFFSSVWSPPAWMKTTNCVHNGGSLREDKYQAYAEYLSAYIRGYKDKFGIRIEVISIANEPNLVTHYSSCEWSGEQIRIFVRQFLLPVFERDNVICRIMLPETEKFGNEYSSYYSPALLDPDVCERVDIIAQHGYGGIIEPLTLAREKGKKVWQTEICEISIIPFEDTGPTIRNGIFWAKQIHEYLVKAEVNAFCFFWAASKYHDGGDALVGLNLEKETVIEYKRLFAMGNFSRFIRPNHIRIEVEHEEPIVDVLISAYRNRCGDEFVIVVINENETDTDVDFLFPGYIISKVRAFRTSATEDLKEQPEIVYHPGVINAVLPAMSITTYIGKIVKH